MSVFSKNLLLGDHGVVLPDYASSIDDSHYECYFPAESTFEQCSRTPKAGSGGGEAAQLPDPINVPKTLLFSSTPLR